jgi:hypothetical protein
LGKAIHFAQTLSKKIDSLFGPDRAQKLHGSDRRQKKHFARRSDRDAGSLG